MRRKSSLAPTLGIIVALVVVSTFGYWWGSSRGSDPMPDSPSAPAPGATVPATPPAPAPSASAPGAAPVPTPSRRVIAVSVDGLSVQAVNGLGERGMPHLHRLLQEGASTLNARTAYEQNVTLPNHTGMITGRRINRARGGHGVTWNDDRPDDTVQDAAGEEVDSIFTAAHDKGLATALFSGKSKFNIFPDSWPEDVDEFEIVEDPEQLVDEATDYLADAGPGLTFLHLDPPDAAGHASGGMSGPYLDAVRMVDRLLGEVIETVEDDPELAGTTTIVLTADHGFQRGARNHGLDLPENYTIPFLVWGAGVGTGDLYQRNPDRSDPGTARPSYDGPQPVRNRDLAAVSLRALGLPPVQAGDATLAW